MEKSKSNWKIKEVIKSFLGREITTYKIITRWFEHENSRNPVRFTKEMASTGSKETASLIASAPEMLEMLKELQDVFKMKDSLTQGPGTSMGTIINDKLDNLITKAEGK